MRPACAVTTSWDDGHPLDLRIAERLVRHGIPGTFYVPRRCRRQVMDRASVRSLAQAFEVGAHTMTHPILTSLPLQAAASEIRDSKQYIEDLTGRDCLVFAPPGGKFRTAHLSIAGQAGYRGFRTVELLNCAWPGQRGGIVLLATTLQVFEHPAASYIRNAVQHLQCYLYSDGGEWYWQRAHGVQQGAFRSEYLPGFWLGRVRIAPRLIGRLLSGRYDVFIKCINNRFAVPVTYLAARFRRVPFILWTPVWCRLHTPLQRLIFPVTQFLYRHSDAIVANGEHVRRYLIEEGVAPDRIFVAQPAVDNGFYGRAVSRAEQREVRASLGIDDTSRIILFLGRLEPVKGIEYLLRAFAGIRGSENAVLVLCGTGSLEAGLRRWSRDLGISARVRFAGYVAPAEATRYYSTAWAVVLPSVTLPAGRETWGVVANEAFNQGVPMIASEAVGAAAGGLVRHNRNGLVTPERDSSALAQALDRILNEPGLRDELGRQAREDVLWWTQPRMAEAFRAAAAFVLGRKFAGAAEPAKGATL